MDQGSDPLQGYLEGGSKMVLRSKALAVLVLVAVVALAIAAGSSVMARPGLWCSLATPCVAKSVEKVEPSENGWLGVEIQELTPELREVLELGEDTRGVLVAAVSEGSPADKAGIGKGDVIVALDTKDVEDTSGLVRLVSKRKPGDVVTIRILREGQKKAIKVTLGRQPKGAEEEFAIRLPKSKLPEEREGRDLEIPDNELPNLESLPPLEHFKLEVNRGRLGVNVVDLNPELGSYFGATKGALVTEVMKDTAAEEAGIKAGDVIVKADGKPVGNREELIRVLSKREVGDKVELVVLRKGKEMKLSATLEEGPFMAWVQGMKKKGSSIPNRYITPGVERFKGNTEVRRRIDDLSREMDALREKLDKLNEDLKGKKD
jgi:serine protease Do